VVTSSEELKRKIEVLRDHGQEKKYYHSMVGWNARMDGIQAAVLRVKLRRLDASNRARRAHAQMYNRFLAALGGVLIPKEAEESLHVYHLYVIRVAERDRVLKGLTQRGVGCGIHYPIPVHLQQAYSFLGYRTGDFPVAERCAQEFLSLPMFPELSPNQIQTVIRELGAISRCFNKAHECIV
jgi:dTDP-4-amino-4,6-dideoxygalactose transaminase